MHNQEDAARVLQSTREQEKRLDNLIKNNREPRSGEKWIVKAQDMLSGEVYIIAHMVLLRSGMTITRYEKTIHGMRQFHESGTYFKVPGIQSILSIQANNGRKDEFGVI